MTDVTVALLIYKSTRWLDFVLEGLDTSFNETKFQTLVVANDPTEEIKNDPRVNYVHINENPEEHYLKRTYCAWNKAVEIAETKYVILVNSDMYFSDYWVDELMRWVDGKTIPCSLLVESGWIPSAFPEYVNDFGRTPDVFNKQAFLSYADSVRYIGLKEHGRLFMPCVFERNEFLAVGGYPPGNLITKHQIISGDRILFNRFLDKGYDWITARGSIVWHAIEGELRDQS
jgi:hypothetical protein